MNERGQKIYKTIVWVVLVLALGIFLLTRIGCAAAKKDYMTRKQWMKYLATEFDDEKISKSVERGNKTANVKYAVETAMELLGDDRVEAMAEDMKVADKDLVDLAVKLNVVKKGQLNDKLSEDMAGEVVSNVLALYCDPQYYPQYCELKTKKDAVDTEQWQISKYNKEKGTITAKLSEEQIPEKGEVIICYDEYGIASVKRVKNVEATDDGEYKVKTEEIEDLSEVLEEISFSGSSDFSYLSGAKDDGNGDTYDEEGADALHGLAGIDGQKPLLLTEDKTTELAWEWFDDKTAIKQERGAKGTEKCDIEVSISFQGKNQDGTDKDLEGSGSAKITTGKKERLYKVAVGKDGVPQVSKTSKIDNDTFQFDLEAGTDPDKFELTHGVAAKVTVKGLTVSTSGYYQWADPDDEKNYIEAVISCDSIRVESMANIEHAQRFKVMSVPVPIAATAGAISLDVQLYLEVSASGEVSAYFQVNHPSVTMNVSVKDGLKIHKASSGSQAGIAARAEIGLGGSFEVDVAAFEECIIADPSVKCMAYASVATFEIPEGYVLKEEYENVPKCLEMQIKAPEITLKIASGNTSIMYELLDHLKCSYEKELISKEKAPCKPEYHMEFPSAGRKFNMIKLSKDDTQESVCTHIEEEEEESTEEETEETDEDEDSDEDRESGENGSDENGSDGNGGNNGENGSNGNGGNNGENGNNGNNGTNGSNDRLDELQSQVGEEIDNLQDSLTDEMIRIINEILEDVLIRIQERLEELDRYMQETGEEAIENFIETVIMKSCEKSCEECE